MADTKTTKAKTGIKHTTWIIKKSATNRVHEKLQKYKAKLSLPPAITNLDNKVTPNAIERYRCFPG